MQSFNVQIGPHFSPNWFIFNSNEKYTSTKSNQCYCLDRGSELPGVFPDLVLPNSITAFL